MKRTSPFIIMGSPGMTIELAAVAPTRPAIACSGRKRTQTFAPSSLVQMKHRAAYFRRMSAEMLERFNRPKAGEIIVFAFVIAPTAWPLLSLLMSRPPTGFRLVVTPQ